MNRQSTSSSVSHAIDPGPADSYNEDNWSDRSNSPSRICTICAAPSNGFHFNAASCSACAAFFRRTVTLNRLFVCSQNKKCRVNYAMRVICRACRYDKCLQMGMERKAVQPRRDCNAGRRKISYTKLPPPAPDSKEGIVNLVPQNNQTTCPPISPEINYALSYASSASDDIPSPKFSVQYTSNNWDAPEVILESLLRDERLHNERRKLLYCAHSRISDLLTCSPKNDIPYDENDIKVLTFAGIQKDIRAQILVIYEWMRGWQHFGQLDTQDKKIFLRRCILYHTILDPAYLTVRLGLPNRFVMFNGMYVGIDAKSEEGWMDEENNISAEMKKKLYRPLLERVVNEIAHPMRDIQLTFTEFLFLKSLVSFKSASASDISPAIKELMVTHMNILFRALHHHYVVQGMEPDMLAERMGSLILLMSSVYSVGMECLESHQKIQFFDLWQLDDLLLKLISRSGTR